MLEELSGVRLSTRPELVEPRRSLVSILDAMRAAYTRAGLINADLSEYNILTDGERVWLIDWPQAVGRTHPNARELLSHDVLSVLKFFERAYEVAEEEARALEYVEGRTERLEQD